MYFTLHTVTQRGIDHPVLCQHALAGKSGTDYRRLEVRAITAYLDLATRQATLDQLSYFFRLHTLLPP